MELIGLHWNASTWHHNCGINSTEPKHVENVFNPFFQSHLTIGIMLKRTSSGVTHEHVQ